MSSYHRTMQHCEYMTYQLAIGISMLVYVKAPLQLMYTVVINYEGEGRMANTAQG